MYRLIATSLAVALFAACSSDSDTPDADTTEGCDPAFAAWGEAGFSGSIVITADGEVECQDAFGDADREAGVPNTPDTVFDIGSVTKGFTAAAVLDLVDQGKLALDDRAGDLVAGLGGPAAEATVEQLLLHTSGLTGSHGEGDDVPLDEDAAIASLGKLERALEQGTDFLYSNSGYTLLALIVEEASGTSYREYVTSELLTGPGGFWNGEPAAPGPRAVGYLDDGTPGEGEGFTGPFWATEGNGGLAMAMGELAGWAGALFSGELLSDEATETLRTLTFDQGDGTAVIPGWVAFDSEQFGEPAYAAAGGGGTGHNVVVAVLPESGRVIAMASNTADLSAEELLDTVGPALITGEELPRPDTSTGSVDPDEAAAVAGSYVLDTGGGLEVAADGDQLAISATGADAVTALFPLPDGYTAADAADHEVAVQELLAGETEEGRKERGALEADLGALDEVTLAGTIVRDYELRTYVTLRLGSESLLGWYALDDEGGIGAAEIDTEPPTQLLVPSGGGAYEAHDPTGAAPDIAVTFSDDELVVDGPAGPVTAQRRG
jgi:CubicO group peptidase (beta-lactamase class C family)